MEKKYELANIFKIDRILLTWTGIYPRTADHSSIATYYFRRLISFLVQIWLLTTSLIFLITNITDAMKIAETLFICASVACSMAKTINFILNGDKVILLDKYISQDIFHNHDDENNEIVTKKMNRVDRLMNLYRWVAFQSILTYYPIPLFTSKHGHRLPIASCHPWNTRDNVFNYAFTYAAQVLTILLSAGLNTVSDTMFASSCDIISIELCVLKNNLKKLNYLPNNYTLRVANTVEDLFTFGVMVQFFTSIMVICFVGFHLTTSSRSDYADSFEMFTHIYGCLGYLGCMVIQVSIYCIYGHSVMDESSGVIDATYLSHWYLSDLHSRKDLMILRERAKKAVKLTAGKIFPLTVETLVQIFRSSYSFLALLQQMN